MAEDAKDAGGQPERTKRKFHTRSRAGCINCRQRHRRCDEKRPSCSRCVALKDVCRYKTAQIPLRERGMQMRPGEHVPFTLEATPSLSSKRTPAPQDAAVSAPKPWSLQRLHSFTSWQMVPWQSVDPFDALPIHMPLRSKELLHYFFQGHNSPIGEKVGRVETIFQDPHSLRTLILVAGVHYAWNIGDLRSFQSTYLHHKIESIRTVNTWLEKGSSGNNVADCCKHIATLCFAECYLGNVALAEMHLHGLIMYLESQLSKDNPNPVTLTNAQRELIDRYLIISYSIVVRLKSPLQDAPETLLEFKQLGDHIRSGHLKYIEHRSKIHDVGGNGLRLKSIRMFPFFFNATPVTEDYQYIDARPMIRCLRDITEVFNMRYKDTKTNTAGESRPLDMNRVGWPMLLFAAVKGHLNSLPTASQNSNAKGYTLGSSWSGISVGCGMYMTAVLHAWKKASPSESRLICYLLTILRRDTLANLKELKGGSEEARNLWFWKVFVGAFSLAHTQSLAGEKWFQQMLADFAGYIRMWAAATGVTRWKEVKVVLSKIVWPTDFRQEDEAEALWLRTVPPQTIPTSKK